MKKLIAAAALLAAGTALANAEEITISSGRMELTTSNSNTYTVNDGGQLFLNSWSGSSRTPTTFECDVVLNGAGYTKLMTALRQRFVFTKAPRFPGR